MLERIYILSRPTLIKYINRAKIWTMKQMGRDGLKAEQKGWEWVGWGTSVASLGRGKEMIRFW